MTLAALILRLIGLGSKSLWIDEAASVYFARHAWPDLIFGLCDPHPPLYYALLKVVLPLSESEWAVRLPSALAGALTVLALALPGFEMAATRRADERTGLLAALLLAVSPLHVWYAQEARMYALAGLLAAAAGLFALRFARRGRAGDALLYLLLAAAAMLTDGSALAPLAIANLLWFAAWHRQPQRRSMLVWCGLQGLIGVLVWTWWSHTRIAALGHAGLLYQWTLLARTLARWGVQVSPTVAVLTVAALGLIGVAGIAGLWVRGRRAGRAADLAAAWTVIGLFALGTAFSVVPRLFTVKRLLLPALPYAMLLSAWAMIRVRLPRRVWAGIVAVCLGLCLVNILWVDKEPWREAVARLDSLIAPGDALWVDEMAVPAFDYYDRGAHSRRVLRAADLATVAGPTGAGRVWLVVRVDRNRNLLDAFPAQAAAPPAWAGDWPGISVRAYDLEALEGGALVPAAHLPDGLLSWPSPLDETCR